MVPLEAAERLAGEPRALFVGCLADTTTAPAMTRRLFDRCNLPRERRDVWFADRAGHILARSKRTRPVSKAWPDRVLRWPGEARENVVGPEDAPVALSA